MYGTTDLANLAQFVAKKNLRIYLSDITVLLQILSNIVALSLPLKIYSMARNYEKIGQMATTIESGL